MAENDIYTDTIWECGDRLRQEILKKDINLTDMAKHTGIPRSTVWRFLYRGGDISSLRLAKLCVYVGVSMDYIMGLRRES